MGEGNRVMIGVAHWSVLLGSFLLAGCVAGPGSALYDFDGDGSPDEEDCNSADPSIYPGALDTFGDGVDQDCDGGDGVDSDSDGFQRVEVALRGPARSSWAAVTGTIVPRPRWVRG
jgi:hypothetical protein